MSDADNSAADAVLPSAHRERLWFVGSLPPPVNGQANCNAAMHALLADRFNLAVLPLGRSIFGKIRHGIRNGWRLLRQVRRGEVAYLSVPGQQGAWLLLLAIAALRLRGASIWFHHHSFRPINRGPLRAMRALVACAGSRQNHILLSENMRDQFREIYLSRNNGYAHVLSNTFLFAPDGRNAIPPRPDRPLTIGHLSVLTREKGVFYLLDLFEELRRQAPGIRLVVAGPTQDMALHGALREVQARYPGEIDYRGSISGEHKVRFYRDIDAFVLPTTLVDEAEPLVMIEAYSHGVDVFASKSGCIPDRIRTRDNLLTLDLATDTIGVAKLAGQTPDQWACRRQACRTHVDAIAAAAEAQGRALIRNLQECATVPGVGLRG